MNLKCPRCGGALRYQQLLSSSCERCVDCGWLSLGMSHAEVVKMCRDTEAARLDKPE